MRDVLDFEKPLLEIEARLAELRQTGSPEEAARLEERLRRQQRKVFANLTPWQRVQLARHPRRPYTLDFIRLLMEDFVELHGDRAFGDDRAVVGGLARFEGQSVVVVGHQKGRDTREKILRNFGMPHPEGYRKALRLMKLAEKFGKPVVTFIDTPGAYPGIGAEERGQAEAIARNLREMTALGVPIVVLVTGEGGSGGALALGVGDRVLMLEHAVYSVISPEGCAAEILRLTAADLLKLGVIDRIVGEPPGGAHRDWEGTAEAVRGALRATLDELRTLGPDELVGQRYAKFRRIGVFEEAL
ncbi:MAG: acetyl-CoA carboxylase carboxyltransferase subunit alpha [Candidatus Rokubacteria bacterium]|nr:acetyl-CoA carboxylase carboxyltransferase subunit alpha [Candidatus Rokubacteria bacterium]